MTNNPYDVPQLLAVRDSALAVFLQVFLESFLEAPLENVDAAHAKMFIGAMIRPAPRDDDASTEISLVSPIASYSDLQIFNERSDKALIKVTLKLAKTDVFTKGTAHVVMFQREWGRGVILSDAGKPVVFTPSEIFN